MASNSSSLGYEKLVHEMQTLSALSVVASLLAGFVAYCVYQYFFSPLAGIPGPFSVRCGLYGWMTYHGFKMDYAEQLKYWHDSTKSPLIRITSKQVSVADPEAIPVIYKNWEKTRFYQMFTFTSIPTGMTMISHEEHARQVKSDGPLFTKASLLEYEAYMDGVAHDFMDLLKREAKDGKTVQDMGRLLRYYTLDLIGEVAFGKGFGALERNSAEDILDLIDKAVYGITIGGLHPRIAPPLLKFAQTFNLGGVNFVRQTAGAGARASIARAKEGHERTDLMAKMLTLKHWKDGGPYCLEEIEGMASVFFGAGTDTAAVVLRAFVYYMVKNPSCYSKLVEELDAAVADGTLHFPTPYSEALKLEYFQACLQEVIRMHPAVPMTLPRTVPKEGAVIAGRYLPGGFEVGMSPYVVHRTEAAFGPDANFFRPSRWLDATPAEKVALHSKIITFGWGARVCVGKNLGLMGISKLLFNLFYHHTIAFLPRSPTSPHKYSPRGLGGNTSPEEPWHVYEGFLAAQADFWCELTEREGLLA